MKIRRYIAKDMRQALKQVRDAQGPDAVILSSRRLDDGVEVVAAVDFDAEAVMQAAESAIPQVAADYGYDQGARHEASPAANAAWAQASAPRTDAAALATSSTGASFNGNDFAATLHSIERAAARLQPGTHAAGAAASPVSAGDDAGADMGSELRTLRRMLETQIATLAWNDLTRRAPLQTALLQELTQLGFARSLAVEVVSTIPARMELHEAQRMALALVAKRLKTDSERWLEQGGKVAFVGPTGVGKSTLVAKLAARWVLRHGPRELALVCADSVRMGAQEQFQNLGRLLGVATYTVDQLQQLPEVLQAVSRHRLVLIDTAGFSQRDARLAAELSRLAGAHPHLETSLVLAASAQAGTLEETLLRFAPAAPRSVVLTKVDEATSLGGSISALIRHGIPLAWTSEGQRIPEDLHNARAHQLVARAVELARRSGANTDEELLTLRFGGVAHALA